MMSGTWSKSSRCGTGHPCVEARWARSSRCTNDTCVEVSWHKAQASVPNGACVEVSSCTCDQVQVRDSKDPQGPVLTFSGQAWEDFLEGIKSGELR